ncbi:phosphonate C-P lyase system protein PhnH [Polycladidibacter hongkongensis]|uniref:phosphonate C-P lyase system protein PhnH n=1 Tax=Polycladidibacter hongkongensis TaxID=1647556 RepID=UPI00082B7EB3|nr:phosphonate C-P lyase system protein PhnH [Pseudovibrio hongkongensis]
MASANLEFSLAKAPAPGLQNPVHEAQGIFRALMNALARPGKLQDLPELDLNPPAPLGKSTAAIALCLCDYDTPIWLDKELAAAKDVTTYLRFHTGASFTNNPMDAAFAFVSKPENMPPLSAFAKGTSEYPDRSTTIVLSVSSLSHGQTVKLSGPGIKKEQGFAATPLPPQFWREMQTNNELYPLGVDVLLAAEGTVAGLPRSTKITFQES